MSNKTDIFPYFQPIICISTGCIVGYEALARQYNAQGEVVSAGALFSEKKTSMEYLIDLDRDVRCLALQKFAQMEDESSYLTLNISAGWIDYITTIHEGTLPTLDMIERLNIDRSRIIIEITESGADIEKLKLAVAEYRRFGLRVAIDDYGSGYSQLDRVIALNPDIIKIDMDLFKAAVEGDRMSGEVLQMLSRFAQRQGFQVICEGVETAKDFLYGLSCGFQFMQGFLFSAAQAEFVDANAYQKKIRGLRENFVKNKIAEEQQETLRLHKVEQFIYQLKQALQDDFNLNELVTWGFEDYDILRFYLCKENGEQTSPNFNFNNGKWAADADKIGYNWAWRPYFYSLIALNKEGNTTQKVIISDDYLDVSSGKLCQTLSIHVSTEIILMVDIKK